MGEGTEQVKLLGQNPAVSLRRALLEAELRVVSVRRRQHARRRDAGGRQVVHEGPSSERKAYLRRRVH